MQFDSEDKLQHLSIDDGDENGKLIAEEHFGKLKNALPEDLILYREKVSFRPTVFDKFCVKLKIIIKFSISSSENLATALVIRMQNVYLRSVGHLPKNKNINPIKNLVFVEKLVKFPKLAKLYQPKIFQELVESNLSRMIYLMKKLERKRFEI